MMRVAQSARSTCTPTCPSPPTPMTTQRDPGASRAAAFLAARYAVIPASANGATSLGSRRSSSLMSERSDVRRKFAKPPSMLRPGNSPFSQYMSSPRRQPRQTPQLINGCTITGSPGATLSTASPTTSTQPAFSCPSV
jgi:hypothetical protein